MAQSVHMEEWSGGTANEISEKVKQIHQFGWNIKSDVFMSPKASTVSEI